MKNIYSILHLALFCIVCLVSCNSEKARQKKAEDLISKMLFESLPDFESYQNVSLQIDTLDVSVLLNTLLYEYAEEYQNITMNHYLLQSELSDLENKEANLKKKGQNQFWFGHMDGYDLIRYGQQFDNIKTQKENLKYQLKDNELSQANIISQVADLVNENITKKEAIAGWKVYHKFRAKDETGVTQLYNMVYLITPDMKAIKYKYDEEDVNNIILMNTIDDLLEKAKVLTPSNINLTNEENYKENIQTDIEPHELKINALNNSVNSLPSQENNTYHASNLTDGKLSTGWAVNLDDEGYDKGEVFGPTIEIEPVNNIDYITINNGYGKSESSFKNNTRANWIQIYRIIPPDTGQPEKEDILYEGTLKDTNELQKLEINKSYDFSRPTKHIKLKFTDKNSNGYYYGDKYKDLVISEIKIYGH